MAERWLHLFCHPQVRRRRHTQPRRGPSTVKGIHHIGFYVDDLAETCATLEAAHCTECPGSNKVNRKYKGPDGLMVDVRARGWDEQIKARMQLYQLTPASVSPV